MATDPQYVRLSTQLQEGIVCDVQGSGWSIAGYDVKKFPEKKEEARFVRSKLNAGMLESASKAEYDEAKGEDLAAEVARQAKAGVHQEGKLQEVAAEVTAKLADKLGVSQEALMEAYLEADAEDRQARLDEAEEAGLNTDDPEEQKARTRGQVPAKKAGGKKGAAKKEEAES